MAKGKRISDTFRIMVIVKTYPNPVYRVNEATCVAGIIPERGFIRLFPIPWRHLPEERRFSKWQWITTIAKHHRNDSRPESFIPDINSISLGEKVDSEKGTWNERLKIIRPFIRPSLCSIVEDQKREGSSLGIFPPLEVLDFKWSNVEKAWTPKEIAKITQGGLFDDKDLPLLEKIPFDFRFSFRCQDCKTGKQHVAKIVDWELGQQFRKLRDQEASELACLKKLKDKWLGELCSPDKSTFFIVGNTFEHRSSFLVLGVIWPNKIRQASLF